MATKILKSLIVGYCLTSLFLAVMFTLTDSAQSFFWGFIVSLFAWPAILIVGGLTFLLLTAIEEHNK